MQIQIGELTVGDIGVNIVATADETLAGKTIRFEFIKPSGKMLDVVATSTSGQTATYTTTAGAIDEAGIWNVMIYNGTTGFYYQSIVSFKVNDTPANMARG